MYLPTSRSFKTIFTPLTSPITFRNIKPTINPIKNTSINPSNNAFYNPSINPSRLLSVAATAPQSHPSLTFPNVGKDITTLPPRVRFAPSPTGSLHVGGARTALYNWLIAEGHRMDGGKGASFVVRVEDTDVERSTKESEISVLSDLKWLGLNYDEGPDSTTSFGPYRQSERSDLYKSVADMLLRDGNAYKCWCTKEELEAEKEAQIAAGISPRYGGKWRDADPAEVSKMEESGAPYTVRFKVPPGSRVVIDDMVRGTISWDADSTVGDFILLRSTGVPVYNFCVAVDDALMGITTVVRAEEHLTNTLRQGLVLDALKAPRPRYAHCSLILGEDNQKLSKRHGATSCGQFKDDGYLPDAMVNYLALLGWNDGTDKEVFTREELVEGFNMERVNPSGAVFDMDKLNWVNSQHLKSMSVDDVAVLVKDQLLMEGITREDAKGTDSEERIATAATCLAKQMMATTKDAAHNARDVLEYKLPNTFDELEGEKRDLVSAGNFYMVASSILSAYDKGAMPRPNEANLMEAFVEQTDNKLITEDNDTGGGAYAYPQAWKAFMKQLAQELGLKGKNLFHPARLAITGEFSGQDVTKQMTLVALASEFGSAIDLQKTNVVPLEVRMELLRGFLETVPEEFRVPKKKEEKEEPKAGDVSTEASGKGKSGKNEVEGGKGGDDGGAKYEGPPFSALDIRVGLVKKVWKHEESEKLFCEEVDVGEDEPRMIASGLQGFVNEEDFEGRKVLVVCNLKERKLAGFPSHGMVLCASNEEHDVVKFVDVPVGAEVGERVFGGGMEGEQGGKEEGLREDCTVPQDGQVRDRTVLREACHDKGWTGN
eukprot:CAMPEP_0118671560 /NCGR_PEP_ID=MMETSP0785-20121206/22068_1 /TAXON_ID=91992 /ORGANISM="Bolidomonas pacifica, Strain CCMP 1866" /LENGTH=827 /DNA_ID=CAMNT_0006566455 /DNA_START=102 /DNA_END=2582 /DNA_ORIENTATION=-